MKLPSSSFKILRLIILGYLHQGGSERRPANYEQVAAATGIGPTIVSGNNKALVDLKIIEPVKRGTYRLTEPGLEIARSLEFGEPELTKRTLGSVLLGNSVISQSVNMLRLRDGMAVEGFVRHLLMAAGFTKRTAQNQTGARAIIEMLEAAGLVAVEDDRLVAVAGEGQRLSTRDDDDEEPAERARPHADDDLPVKSPSDTDEFPSTQLFGTASVQVSVTVTLTGDDLADSKRAADISTAIRGLLEMAKAAEDQA